MAICVIAVTGVAPPAFFFVDLWRGQVDYADYFVPLQPAVNRQSGHALLVVARPAAHRPWSAPKSGGE